MRRRFLVIAIAVLAAPSAQAFQPGALLIVEPFLGVRQWVPGEATSTLVISGGPLGDPRAVAIDAGGNAIVADRAAGTFRYSPSGALIGNIGIWGIDVAVGPNGGIYVLTDGGQVYRVEPTILLASGIADPRGLAVARDAAGNERVIVTSGANGGQVLRIPPSGPPVAIVTNFGSNIGQPGVDRFGNLLVSRDIWLYALDPETGAQRGWLTSSAIDPQDTVATSGDRYFVADGDAGGNCRIVEVDPLSGSSALVAGDPVCSATPWGMAVVPGGTPAPTLATNDIVMTDPSAFGGAGAILRIDPVTGAPRPLLLGGKGSQWAALNAVSLGIGPTREVAYTALVGANEDRILRLDPKTGRTTLLYTGSRGIAGPAYDHRGNLYFVDQAVRRVDRTTGATEGLFVPWDADVFALLVTYYPLGSFPYQIGDTFVGTLARSGGSVRVRDTYLASESGGENWFSLGYYIWNPVTPPSLNIRTFGGWAISTASPPGLYFPFHPVTIPIPDAVSPRGVAARRSSTGIPEAHYMADTGAYGGGGAVFREQGGVVTRLTTATFVDPLALELVPPPSCGDGLDNDDDGQIDFPADTGCTSADDPWETADCSDGIDNDLDGTIDYDANGDGDPGCNSSLYGIEGAQCSNGADDDGDGRIDAADGQCTGPSDNRERPNPACGLLGIEVVMVAGWAICRSARRRSVRADAASAAADAVPGAG